MRCGVAIGRGGRIGEKLRGAEADEDGTGVGVVVVVVVVWHRPITGARAPGRIGAPLVGPLREQKVGGTRYQRYAPGEPRLLHTAQ